MSLNGLGKNNICSIKYLLRQFMNKKLTNDIDNGKSKEKVALGKASEWHCSKYFSDTCNHGIAALLSAVSYE